MDRFEKLDVTSSTHRPNLLPNETILLSQADVGLYEGKERLTAFDKGIAYITTHRLLWCDEINPTIKSMGMNLSSIHSVDSEAGLFKSSPKILLGISGPPSSHPFHLDSSSKTNISLTSSPSRTALSPSPTSSFSNLSLSNPVSNPSSSSTTTTTATTTTWKCTICGENNASNIIKCTLCGVPKQEQDSLKSNSSSLSTSFPPQHQNQHSFNSSGNVCPACTFINHIDLLHCEMCGTRLSSSYSSHPPPIDSSIPFISTPQKLLPDTPQLSKQSEMDSPIIIIKLAFRSGGQTVFLNAIKSALAAKEWQKSEVISNTSPIKATLSTNIGAGISYVLYLSDELDIFLFDPSLITQTNSSKTNITKLQKNNQYFSGAIMRSADETITKNKESLSTAFSDLDGLMEKASEMVKLAESIRTKLAKENVNEDSNEMNTFKNYLVDIGISSPVTKQSAGNSYIIQLSKELAEFLERVVDKRGSGVMALSDVYCLFNRARGVALVSPEDLYKASLMFESLNLKFRLRRFDSGLLVIQSHILLFSFLISFVSPFQKPRFFEKIP